MGCRIIYNKDKQVDKVLAPNNKESILYNDILNLPEINGNKDLALRQWAYAYISDFKDKFGDWENNPEEFTEKLDENGEPLIQYITNNDDLKLNNLKGGNSNILEVRERESKKNIFIESISEFETDEEITGNLINIEDRLKKTYDTLQDNLDYQLKILKRFDKEGKNANTIEISNLIDKLEDYAKVNRLKGVIHYINTIDTNIKRLQHSFEKKSKNNEDMLQLLERYKRYSSLYDVIDDIKKIFEDAVTFGEIVDNKRISNKINEIKIVHDSINEKFSSVIKNYMVNHLNKPQYHNKIITNWEERFERQYNDIYQDIPSKLKNKESKKNWINQKLIEYKSSIQKDIDKATKELIFNTSHDITYFAEQFLSSLEINSDLVQIVQTELTEVRDNMIQELTPIDKNIAETFNDFKKEKGSYNPSKQFHNLIDIDKNGNYYLKGDYKIQFKDKHNELLELYDQRNDAKEDQDDALIKTLNSKINKLRKQLYNVSSQNKILGIKDVWKNDLSNLTKVEKNSLELFRSISNDSTKNTMGINSLTKEVGFGKGAKFYKFPSITISDLERVIGGKSKGVLKDKYKTLTTLRPDEVGYEAESVKATASGKVIRDIPIHYRGKIDPKEQSLDLFTMYKMEAQNSVTFKHRKEKEMFLEFILDVATNKKYYQTKGLSFTPLHNKFAKRNKELAVQGNENTKIIKKIRGMMDSQFYDITKKYQGKFGNVDIQKIVSFVNGYAGMLGMTLNYHSALVNLTGGYAQFLIHAMSKDIINVKNIKKALAVYTKETANNIKDIGNPDNKSFVNQLNIMFDTFGGYNIGTESFLKDKAWKKFANLHGLTGLHQLGEHQLQSVITMAVLDSVEGLNQKGEPIVQNKKNASILDLLSLDNNNVLQVHPSLTYTSHSPLVKWNEGGRVQVQQLLKYKIFQTLGNYDNNMQPENMKTAQGRLLLMFKRFFVSLSINRFRSFNTALTKKENLNNDERFYSNANKRYEEGTYTTTLRFITFNILPALKNLKLKLIMQDFSKLTDYEKSNVIKFSVEMSMAVVLGIISSLIVQAADDEDDELLYFLAYTMRRMESELKQFLDVRETIRITRTPFAAIRPIENAISFMGHLIDFTSWDERYDSGKRKGELKINRQFEKIIPILNKTDRSNKELYNYLENSFMGF